jgi:hypothetical protein
MAPIEDGVPRVDLPERVDRRLRLGPFPSARDALKFLCYAAAGALLAPFLSLPAGLGVVAVGFLAAAWYPDGQPWDERALAALRWKWRTSARESAVTTRSGSPLVRHGFVRLAPSQYVAILRTAGTPIAYLPPAELARRFEMFRELLRATDGHFALLSTFASIHSSPFSPPAVPTTEPDGNARAGYAELVRLLCRRRLGRRVYFALGGSEVRSDSIARLEGQVASVVERLQAFGLRPVRLKDRTLFEAARRFGWSGPGSEP